MIGYIINCFNTPRMMQTTFQEMVVLVTLTTISIPIVITVIVWIEKHK